MTILLLAGTAEARKLSHRLSGRADLVSSLAGATDVPLALGGKLRMGGFGGVDGLQGFLRDNDVKLLIDATHPFAAQMSRHAHEAAENTGLPLLQILRPPWPEDPNWTMVSDLTAAADALATGTTAFLATGRGSVPNFQHRRDVDFVLRVIDDKPGQFPLARGRFLCSRPPFTVEQEIETLREHAIDVLVSRNAGGRGGTEKLDAAQSLGIPVIMAQLPELPCADRVETVDAAMDWLARHGWLDA